MSYCVLRAALWIGMLMPFCSPLPAQESDKTASVVISVKDETGAVVQNAAVQIQPLPATLGNILRTGGDGKVSLELSPGSYDLSVKYPGFVPVTRRIEVQNGPRQTIDVVLRVGSNLLTFIPIEPSIAPSRMPLGQISDFCGAQNAPAQLPSADVVYGDAQELARTLNDVGFPVRCTLMSKMQHFFKGQMGAAFYVLEGGSFEALFLKKTETFDRVEVVERRENSKYLYSFQGTPRSSVHLDSSRPSYFIKRGNVLVYIWGDEGLAASLDAKLTR